MDKFNEIYKDLIENIGDPSRIGRDINSNGNYCQLSHILMENIYFEAIDQNQFSELAPVPKPVLNFLCSKIKPNIQNKFEITYEKMYELLEECDFKDIYDFRKSLDEIIKLNDKSAYLVIGVSKLNRKAFQRLFSSKQMDNFRLQDFFLNCSTTNSGNTFSGSPLLRSRYKNACIWLNLDFTSIPFSNWKDTLSHELTHFIHRVVSVSKTSLTGKIQNKLMYLNSNFNINDYNNEKEMYEKFLKKFEQKLENNMYIIPYIWSLFKGTIFGREQSTTIQNILNGFQRMYQQQNKIKDKINYKKFNDSEQKRMKWLEEKLKQINKQEFFDSQLGANIMLNLTDMNQISNLGQSTQFFRDHKDSILILQYLGVKNLLEEYMIDQKLRKHFKLFKFRDN